MPTQKPSQKPKVRELWFGYDIQTLSGTILRPKSLRFWTRKNPSSNMTDVNRPYGSNALMGLAFLMLNHTLEQSDSDIAADPQMTEAAWRHLEPHYELFRRAQSRVKNYQKSEKKSSSTEKFEETFQGLLENCCQPTHFELRSLAPLLEAIDELEEQSQRPLLFNMNLPLSEKTIEQMHFLFSLLFHCRSQIAEQFNSGLKDVTHQALKVDSITDYLPKSEYVANDALLYWEFKKLKSEMGEKAATTLQNAFWSYAHNGACLAESLPKTFFSSSPQEDLERSLYLAQMDWLLGTPAGILFKIREEIFGLTEGYEKVFWHDHEAGRPQESQLITVQCHLNEKKVFQDSEVA